MTNARPIVGLPTVWETTAFGLCARIAASDIQRKKQYDRHLVMAFVRRSTRTVGAGMPLVTAVCVTLEVKPVNDQFEQRFRLLVESLTDYAVFMIDLSGAMSSWNPGVRSLLGYDAEEFIGLPFAAKAANGWYKLLMRNAGASYLPDEVRWRRDITQHPGGQFRAEFIRQLARHAPEIWNREFVERTMKEWVDPSRLRVVWDRHQRSGGMYDGLDLLVLVLSAQWLAARFGQGSSQGSST